jgi:hypothetical protein
MTIDERLERLTERHGAQANGGTSSAGIHEHRISNEGASTAPERIREQRLLEGCDNDGRGNDESA